MTWALEVDELRAGYRGEPVVHGISLRVAVGEVVALTGLNGAGKTTTLLTLAGVLPALGGTISLFGSRLDRQPPYQRARKGLILVPEGRGICEQLSTEENLRLVRPNRGGLRIHQVLELLPALTPLLKRRAGLLSGGEQQTLALAKAFVAGPRVLLIDELSLGLAPVIVGQILPVIREYAATFGLAVLLVEQHAQVALSVAQRGYVMARGRIAFSGPAAEIASSSNLHWDRPAGRSASS